jgi:superfamily II DNA or RNA helicase
LPNRSGRRSAKKAAATAVWGDSPENERRAALADLAARRVNIVFSVDLFNEGIDVPVVDTLLMLRPTDSPTLFLQQLGRGLRRAEGKTVCTVLDFVGQHRAEFRFDRRFRALLGGSRKDVTEHACAAPSRRGAGRARVSVHRRGQVIAIELRATPGWR